MRYTSPARIPRVQQQFETLLFFDQLKRFRSDALRTEVPLIHAEECASLWLRRVDADELATTHEARGQ